MNREGSKISPKCHKLFEWPLWQEPILRKSRLEEVLTTILRYESLSQIFLRRSTHESVKMIPSVGLSVDALASLFKRFVELNSLFETKHWFVDPNGNRGVVDDFEFVVDKNVDTVERHFNEQNCRRIQKAIIIPSLRS